VAGASLQPRDEHLVRAINKLVAEKTRGYNFHWGSLQISTDNRSGTFHNAANAGPSLAMLLGAFKGGNFTSGATDSSDVGKLFAYDGRVPFQCAESVGRRFLVEVFLHRDAPTWPQHYRDYLTGLGFSLPPKSEASVASGTVSSTFSLVSEPFDRTLVEGCCELGSLFQKKTRFSRGCQVVPITKDDDFASDSGMRKFIEHLKSAAETLWFLAPCTGGSSWQYLNLKRGPKTVAKIRLHWRLFKRLWAGFDIAVSHALSIGARVFIEWPRHCA
jgi:hypothetical protein